MVLKAKQRKGGGQISSCDETNKRAYKKMWSAVVKKKAQVNSFDNNLIKIKPLNPIIYS